MESNKIISELREELESANYILEPKEPVTLQGTNSSRSRPGSQSNEFGPLFDDGRFCFYHQINQLHCKAQMMLLRQVHVQY